MLGILAFSSVRSKDIRPKFRPENNAEKHKQTQMIITAPQIGIIFSKLRIRSHGSDP